MVDRDRLAVVLSVVLPAALVELHHWAWVMIVGWVRRTEALGRV